MKPNADGSFDIYLQSESPGADKESNWLPTPAQPFSLHARLYSPRKAAIDGTWGYAPRREGEVSKCADVRKSEKRPISILSTMTPVRT